MKAGAIQAKRVGRSDLFVKLVRKAGTEDLKNAGYVTYLKSVASIEQNKLAEAEKQLEESSQQNPYAIEQPILLVNLLGHQGKFIANQGRIQGIVRHAEIDFDSDKYATPFSLVSLHYRVGTLALQNKNFKLAEEQFEKAHGKRTLWKKYVNSDEFDDLIDIGRANALYGQGRKEEAGERIEKIRNRTKDADTRERVCAQFMGQCA